MSGLGASTWSVDIYGFIVGEDHFHPKLVPAADVFGDPRKPVRTFCCGYLALYHLNPTEVRNNVKYILGALNSDGWVEVTFQIRGAGIISATS